MLAVKEALRVKLSVRCTPVPQLLTLNDKEDERMRDASFATMREMGVGTAGSAEAACVDG
jgi:carbamoylphosphate synthase large subunit